MNLWSQIYSTNWTNLVAMVPLLFCSILTLAIVIERLLRFRPSAMFSQELVDFAVEKVTAGNWQEAKRRADSEGSLLGVLVSQGLSDRYERHIQPEVAFLDHGMAQLDILARFVPALNFIGRVAPLFGLLGTVLGMIEAFEVLAGVQGGEIRPDMVAQGIGTALLTTAAGLMVAIPALVVSSILTNKGEKLYTRFEDSFRSITVACGGLRISEDQEAEEVASSGSSDDSDSSGEESDKAEG
jgi:biopolymer transport protein ExbB